jgi:hypothetical protein
MVGNAHYEARIREIDEALRPIANEPVDTHDPEWLSTWRDEPAPIDRVGLRGALETLLRELISAYPAMDDETRAAVRRLFAQHPSFTWAAWLPDSPTTEEGFRTGLVLLSMRDQHTDARDEIVALDDLSRQARAAGVDASRVLLEVAELTSDVDRYGMGSTREFFLRYAGH